VKLIVGLGNPGAEYEFTPHNLGFLTIDRLAERAKVEVKNRHCKALTARAKVGGEEVLLAKPETFMNLSGMSVRELVAKYGDDLDVSQDLIVVHDELDFPLGTIRIRQHGSSAGHNGIESIMNGLGTQDFLRVRMGVAPDHPVRDGAGYLLSPWKKKDAATVDDLIERAADAVELILEVGASKAMNRVNRKPEAEGATS
jgi:PTH1 family peptidyl-tRNA hydrolase